MRGYRHCWTVMGLLRTSLSFRRLKKTVLSLEEKVALFRNLFQGRKDVFARRWIKSVN